MKMMKLICKQSFHLLLNLSRPPRLQLSGFHILFEWKPGQRSAMRLGVSSTLCRLLPLLPPQLRPVGQDGRRLPLLSQRTLNLQSAVTSDLSTARSGNEHSGSELFTVLQKNSAWRDFQVMGGDGKMLGCGHVGKVQQVDEDKETAQRCSGCQDVSQTRVLTVSVFWNGHIRVWFVRTWTCLGLVGASTWTGGNSDSTGPNFHPFSFFSLKQFKWSFHSFLLLHSQDLLLFFVAFKNLQADKITDLQTSGKHWSDDKQWKPDLVSMIIIKKSSSVAALH